MAVTERPSEHDQSGAQHDGAPHDRAEHDRARAERRTRRRFARRQWARRWVSLRIALVGVLFLVLVAGSIWFVYFSEATQVKRVDVSGNKLLSASAVRRAAGVREGEQLATVDLERASRRLGALAEVRAVDVTRAWPDTVAVRLVERTAIAVADLNGNLRGLDEEGVIFRRYDKAPPGLPRVVGGEAQRGAWAEAAAVVSALPAELARRVDHLEVATIDQITLVMRDGREVLWGSSDRSDQKAEVLEVLLAERGRFFDVSVPGSPTAR